MMSFLFNRRILYGLRVIGLMSVPALHPLYAQAVGEIVHGLNGAINPRDAQLLQDQARRNNRPAEERYWRDYRAGLEALDRGGETGSGRDRDLHFDLSNPRNFQSEAAISLELRRLSPGVRRRYGEMTDRERRKFDDRLAEDAQRRYERTTDPERRRYIDDFKSSKSD